MGVDHFGILPQIIEDKIPEEFQAKFNQTLNTFVDEVHRSSPVSVIDRARDVASQALLAHFNLNKSEAQDLGELIKRLKTEGRVIAENAANIIARLHARAKPSEQEKRELRPIREQDADLAVQCTVLETYSKRLLPLIEWEPTDKMNVRVLNDTGDFYRYFDATPHAQFLYSCVEQTIDVDLPQEVEFLRRYDQFKAKIEALIEMPASTVDLLFNFLKQNGGTLSKRAREREFSALEEKEIKYIEVTFSDIFHLKGN